MSKPDFHKIYLASKAKRASNRGNSAELLRAAGVEFESKNGGAHLIVTQGGMVFDFWPGTGKWCQRGTADYQRGVFSLLARLGRR